LKRFQTPKFGDIIRYYTNSAYCDESRDIYNGEIHAAIYIGIDSSTKKEIVLTKNGRNDLNFLLYQDINGLDTLYLANKKDQRKKNYFRAKTGALFFDTANCSSCSDCYEAYEIDSLNYQQRLECLAGKTRPVTCNNKASCYCFPKNGNNTSIWIIKLGQFTKCYVLGDGTGRRP